MDKAYRLDSTMNTMSQMCEEVGHAWEFRLDAEPGDFEDVWRCRICRAESRADPFVPAPTVEVVSKLVCRNCAPVVPRNWTNVDWKEFYGDYTCEDRLPGCLGAAEWQLLCSGYTAG